MHFKTAEDCHNKEHFDFIKGLQKKYMTGFYAKSNLVFDPKNDLSQNDGVSFDGIDWTTEYANVEKHQN